MTAETAISEAIAAGKTLATAESCTGGLIGAALTAVPGSSAAYLGGFVTYANEAKQALVGVSSETLQATGAVSGETARQMALGTRAALGADIAVSVTGIAGPGGGSAGKPVGLVYIGLATPAGVQSRRHEFPGGRDAVRAQTVNAALDLIASAFS